MLEEAEKIVISVSQGNPGALRVAMELMYFSKWYSMMQWCEKNLKGSDLWVKYKDVFHCDVIALGTWIQLEMKV